MDRSERFTLFITTLEAAEPSGSLAEARGLIEATLNTIEDRHSGVPFDPSAWQADGRMYPPADDYETPSKVAGVRHFRSRGHDIFLAENGAFRIEQRSSGAIVIDKVGQDGRPSSR